MKAAIQLQYGITPRYWRRRVAQLVILFLVLAGAVFLHLRVLRPVWINFQIRWRASSERPAAFRRCLDYSHQTGRWFSMRGWTVYPCGYLYNLERQELLVATIEKIAQTQYQTSRCFLRPHSKWLTFWTWILQHALCSDSVFWTTLPECHSLVVMSDARAASPNVSQSTTRVRELAWIPQWRLFFCTPALRSVANA